jgi:hypothetical protein
VVGRQGGRLQSPEGINLYEVDHTIKTKKEERTMLSQIPIDVDKVRKEDIDKELRRAVIIAAMFPEERTNGNY